MTRTNLINNVRLLGGRHKWNETKNSTRRTHQVFVCMGSMMLNRVEKELTAQSSIHRSAVQ